ncbi:MAG: amino acid permease [Phycisphaerae bacterium]|jgi:glutamate:GABA antiporter|nr:amino acid permease [Phycisphaerae bacterium]HJN71704.1 amino acid permease [Phycisphaerales bacterium]|tara:strand:+ start:794 stop:2224 length:1431 start_codon:yes stop_codon:yes gene_type:complete
MANIKSKKKLGVFVLAMMNVAVVMSLRGLPMMAKEGMTMVFYLLFASILFLVPVSLVSAELATGWPKNGGVYIWVKEAFGSKLGFTAIWLQWIQNVIWYPTVLVFAAGALAYLFVDPTLAENKFFSIIVILVVYWGATFVNLRGVASAGWLTTAGVIGGTILPGLLIIILGLCWWFGGNPIAFDATVTATACLPDFGNINSLAFLGGIVLLFAGMEVGSVHVNELGNPKKQFPAAIFIAMFVIIGIFTLGSFAVAAVLPADEISLTAGIMQALRDFLNEFHALWLLPILGFLIAFGAIGGVTAWIAGPSRGLLATASKGELPPILQKVNKSGIQVNILMVQGAIVTLISLVYLLMPNVSSAFFLLTALTACLYLFMYMLLFATAIKLRFTKPDVPRAFKVPGGNVGMILLAGVGLLAVIYAYIILFFPPSDLAVGSPTFYVAFLVIGNLIFILLPMIINHFKKPSWVAKGPSDNAS